MKVRIHRMPFAKGRTVGMIVEGEFLTGEKLQNYLNETGFRTRRKHVPKREEVREALKRKFNCLPEGS